MRALLAAQAFLATMACLAALGLAARADEPAEPLVFTVHPSGLAGVETLDEALARRERRFRFICVGCVRAEGRVADAPFRPIETLNAPELTAALAAGR